MGTNCAPFLANIFLHTYEFEYMQLLINNGKSDIARKLSNTFRYQDDCVALNDGGEFGRSFHQIYPNDLELKCEHQGSHATFLDLDINVSNGIFVYKLFDKRDNFPFYIVRMPDLS